jgi:hypothetical protein
LHPASIAHDIVLAESKHAIAFAAEETITSRVAFLVLVLKMLRAIDFDDELRGVRDKIVNVWTDRRLAAKPYAIQPMCAHSVPDDSLSIGQIAPQSSCARATLLAHTPFRRVQCVCHGA